MRDLTPEVLNQSSPFSNYNAFADVALRRGVATHGGRWGFQALERLGATVGSEAPHTADTAVTGR